MIDQKLLTILTFLKCRGHVLFIFDLTSVWCQLGAYGATGKDPACQCKRCKRCRFDHWVEKIPWRTAWQPTPVFLPGESHGQRSLVGYGPKGYKELDTTETTAHTQSSIMQVL